VRIVNASRSSTVTGVLSTTPASCSRRSGPTSAATVTWRSSIGGVPGCTPTRTVTAPGSIRHRTRNVRTDIAVQDESEAASSPNGVAPAGSAPASSGTAQLSSSPLTLRSAASLSGAGRWATDQTLGSPTGSA
jgi:hypothetical protein